MVTTIHITSINATDNTFIKNSTQYTGFLKGIISSITKFEMIIMAILIKLFAISKEASNVLGCSSRSTIRLYPGCCLVLSILISLKLKEKKATSAPDTKKESTRKIISKNTRTVVAWTLIAARGILRKVFKIAA